MKVYRIFLLIAVSIRRRRRVGHRRDFMPLVTPSCDEAVVRYRVTNDVLAHRAIVPENYKKFSIEHCAK